jgi:hypothetical protein
LIQSVRMLDLIQLVKLWLVKLEVMWGLIKLEMLSGMEQLACGLEIEQRERTLGSKQLATLLA